MATPPIGKGYTAAQWEAWIGANANPKDPAYTGTATTKLGTALKGKTWAQVYAALYAAGQAAKPPQSPDQVAVETQVLAATEGIALGAGAAAGADASTITDAGNAAAASAASLGSFLSALTGKTLWIRVAKVIIGGALVIIGLSHLTGAGNAVATAARKVPVIV